MFYVVQMYIQKQYKLSSPHPHHPPIRVTHLLGIPFKCLPPLLPHPFVRFFGWHLFGRVQVEDLRQWYAGVECHSLSVFVSGANIQLFFNLF